MSDCMISARSASCTASHPGWSAPRGRRGGMCGGGGCAGSGTPGGATRPDMTGGSGGVDEGMVA
jgi:hypothetical protein